MSFTQPGGFEIGHRPIVRPDVAPTVGHMSTTQAVEHVRVVDQAGAHLYDTSRVPHDFDNPDVRVSFSGAGMHDGMPVFTRSEHRHPRR